MESSKPKEKERKTKEHITPGNGNRHEKNEQKLDGTRKGGPGQSGLENAGRRPMLHCEQSYHYQQQDDFLIKIMLEISSSNSTSGGSSSSGSSGSSSSGSSSSGGSSSRVVVVE
ncbi:unnamed protein product [Schistosoma margrebowiei]|uniref:Uncharacterized protein n=1 Tax=Schistosoma margrebowiei TaxID=48269 RepID=A0A183LPX6_9TREM|nr:unnamed protein product [Schistosoma margrebowiei]